MARRNWFLEQWKGVIFSDESLFSLFSTTGQVYVLRQTKKAFHPGCFQSTVKNGHCFLEIRNANVFLHGRINKRDYLQILSGSSTVSREKHYFSR